MRCAARAYFRQYGQSIVYLDMGPQPSLCTRAQCFIRFFWLVLVFAHCGFAHCHTSSYVLHFTKFISPHMVLAMPSFVILWLAMSGVGCSCSSGSALSGRFWLGVEVFLVVILVCE